MCSTLCLVGKLICCRTIFGSAANPAHATAAAMHFPANAGLIFLTDELTNDRYLVDTGATLSIVPCKQNSSQSGPPSQRGRWTANPLLGLHPKNRAVSRQTFHIQFFQSAMDGPILCIEFLKKIQGHCCPRDQPNTVCLHCSGLACPQFAFSGPVRLAIFV